MKHMHKNYTAKTLFFVLLISITSGCATGLPEYISRTPSDTVSDIVTTFHPNSDQHSKYTNAKSLWYTPQDYFEQNVPYCGGFSVAAVLSAFGMYNGEPISYFMSDLGRLFGGMFPHDVVDSLERYGIRSKSRRAIGISDAEKLALLRNEIDKGLPVIILVGNGFEKAGNYSKAKSQGITHLHWLSIWGYHEQGFFIYDSVAHPYQYEQVPVGNKERSNKEILRDWVRPFYLAPFIGNTFISIEQIPEAAKISAIR